MRQHTHHAEESGSKAPLSRVGRGVGTGRWVLPGPVVAGPVVAGLVVAMLVGLWAWTWIRVETYVTGEDPYTFLYWGRLMTGQGMPDSSADPSAGTVWTRVAPVWPLALGLARGLGGVFAPFALAPLCVVVWSGLVVWMAWSIGGGDRKAGGGRAAIWGGALGLVVLLWFPIGTEGHLDMAYRLYPFRESAGLCLAAAGLFLAYHARRGLDGLVAGACLLLAIGVRETFGACWLGALGWAMATGRPRVALGVAAPVVVAGVGVLTTLGVNRQVAWMLDHLRGGMEGGPGLLATLEGLAAETLRTMGPCGGALAVVGVWRHRRAPAVWWLFVLPALLTVAAFAPVGMHRRYVLTLVGLLAVPVALGGMVAAGALTRSRTGRHAGLAVCGLLLVVAAARISSERPWGRRVTRHDIRTFRDAVERVTAPGDLLITEPAARRLQDATAVYLNLPLTLSVDAVGESLEAGGRAWYMRPGSGMTLHSATWQAQPARMERALQHRFDLGGRPVALSLGAGRFDMVPVVPRVAREVGQTLRSRPGVRTAIWLDLGRGSLDPAAVEVEDAATGSMWTTRVERAQGVVCVVIPSEAWPGGAATLTVRSDSGLPANPAFAIHPATSAVTLRLDHNRRVALDGLFGAGRLSWSNSTVLRMPPVYGDAADWACVITLEPRPAPSVPTRLRALRGGEELAAVTVSPGQGTAWLSFSMGAAAPGAQPWVLLDAGGDDEIRWRATALRLQLPR